MQMRYQKRPALKLLPLAVAVIAGLHTTAALAQSEAAAQEAAEQQEQQQPAQEGTKKEVTDLDRMTVTGSLIRRVEYDSISPVTVITADTAVDVGQVSASEFLQQSSVAAGSTQINNQFSGFVVEGGTGVSTLSLRGLGPQRTLVLLNGRRPGPAGTRGQVAAFDLNVLPSSILQRAEILKDGASSIYGSDAVAGVVNLITRKDMDGPEVTVTTRVPFDGGGEVYSAAVANGWNFDKGGIMVAAEYYLHQPLQVQDRDFFQCGQDLAFDQQGNRIDREDRSITAGTALGGCNNLYADTVLDFTDRSGRRYVPSPDGSTVGPLPGYRPRTLGTYRNGGTAFYEDVLNFDFYGDTQIIDRQERKSLFVSGDYLFGDVSWSTEFLYNNRETETHRYRQFFPLIVGGPIAVAMPVMPFLSDQKVEVDYFYVNTGLDGYLGDTWAWSADISHTRSEGEYSGLGIVASRSGDVRFDADGPDLNYFDPGFLNGTRMDELVAAVGEWNTGETVYEQTVATGLLSGELFSLPAGGVGAALGFEHRRYSIDDQPSELSRNGDLWGQSSAQVTKGEDRVNEIFGEIEVPLIAGKPGFERLTVNASARAFQYDTVPGTNEVWKVGMGWQVTPAFQLRATKGTSFRAPGLFELYLGNQTAFASQLAIDPCIDWQSSTNDFIRQNCQAAGIPGNFSGGSSSATIVMGGGFGVLESETSRAFTTGMIFTPAFADLSIAIDYFNIEINDQIDRLGAAGILGGCYGSPNYPNAFCGLFDRNSPDHATAPNAITTVRDSYININQQLSRGYDLLVRYENELPVGNLEIEGQFTYMIEDVVRLFDPSLASGFDSDDQLGSIGRPKLVGNLRTAFERGDWTYTWGMNYVHGTKNLDASPTFTYFGFQDAVRDIRAERRVYHTASVRYAQDKWSVLVGVQNLLNEEPPVISSGVGARYGNVPAFATQYDWYGRSLFARFNYKF
jgi:iron complex outermembrane receptor protein